jgi:hypothetical protein
MIAMRYNPFIMQYRKQPTKRLRYSVENPTKTLVNGMVTLGSIAVLGHTVVGVANAFQKG